MFHLHTSITIEIDGGGTVVETRERVYEHADDANALCEWPPNDAAAADLASKVRERVLADLPTGIEAKVVVVISATTTNYVASASV